MFLKRPVVDFFMGGAEPTIWHTVIYYILILPIYNLLLLLFGFLFGQFRFFWAFEKRFLARIFGGGKA